MSLWDNLLNWAMRTATNQAQQIALAAIKEGSQVIITAIEKHTPDVAPQAVAEIQKGVAIAVAGASCKQ